MKISFIGDVCPARQVYSKYKKKSYQIVSDEIKDKLKSNIVIANLESPITRSVMTNGDHLSFRAGPDILDEFDFIDYFSLSNNHINDCGFNGMKETIESLE